MSFWESSNIANKVSAAIKQNELTQNISFDNEPVKNIKCVGIFSRNRVEWVLTDIACMRNSIVTVPFYETLGKGSIEFICNETQLQTIFLSVEKLDILVAVADKCPTVKNIVSYDEITND